MVRLLGYKGHGKPWQQVNAELKKSSHFLLGCDIDIGRDGEIALIEEIEEKELKKSTFMSPQSIRI